MTIVAYVSGHGFGHYTRSSSVLLRLVEGGVAVHVRSAAQGLRLARRERAWASVAEVDVGPGAAQRGPLEVDLPATRAALQQHLDGFEALVDREARALASLGADLVFADVPPLAFAAAARAGVPSVGMSNFSWSWIYEGYAVRDAWFARAAERLARAEGEATRFLALEMGGGLDVFPRRERIDPVARKPLRDRREARAAIAEAFGLGRSRPLVATSFGGFGAELDLAGALARSPAFDFLVVSGAPDLALPNARAVDPSESDQERASARGAVDGDARALSHPDLVSAADCLVGKPGYGTVAECLVRPTPFVHVPRGDFREVEPMVAAIERWLPSAALSIDELHAGRFDRAIERAITRDPRERPITPGWPDGIAQAARRIRAMLNG